MLPNFLIVGPPKSGTTSLQFYLNKHPEVYTTGEAHFFNANYEKGIEWYEKFFEKHNNEKAIGEKTPGYFFDEKTPERIKKELVDVKLLFIFRDPIKRAYSQYWHNVRHAYENAKTFEEAFEKELKDKADSNSKYLEISKYIVHIKRWNKYFPKSKMFFLTMESLDQEVLKDVLGFLEVDKDFDFGELKKYNIGGATRSKSLAKVSQNEIIKKIPYMSEVIKRGVNMKRGKAPEINPITRKRLNKYFEPFNKELEEFTTLDLGKWCMSQFEV